MKTTRLVTRRYLTSTLLTCLFFVICQSVSFPATVYGEKKNILQDILNTGVDRLLGKVGKGSIDSIRLVEERESQVTYEHSKTRVANQDSNSDSMRAEGNTESQYLAEDFEIIPEPMPGTAVVGQEAYDTTTPVEAIFATYKVNSAYAPKISYFGASRTKIRRGDGVNLYWKTSKATSVRILSGRTYKNVGGRGKIKVSPGGSTYYTLYARNKFGTVSKRVRIEVYHGSNGNYPSVSKYKPYITYFRTGSTKVRKGGYTYLYWETGKATSVKISSGRTYKNVAGRGKIKVSPNRTTTYTLYASNKMGDALKRVRIEVYHGSNGNYPSVSKYKPYITYFRTGSTKVRKGGYTYLYWDTGKATSVKISSGRTYKNVAGSGKIKVSPGGSTYYTLYARNKFGTVSKRVWIKVYHGKYPTPRPAR